MNKHLKAALGLSAAMTGASLQPALAQENLPGLAVSSFPSPTASFWFSHLIPKLGLDRKHGFRLTVEAKPSQVAYSDFISGASKACYCIATAAAARFVERGADISQVWIVQTNVSYIVTGDPAIKSAKDLEGKTLAADTATGAWAVAASLISRAGTDLKKVRIQPGSISNSLIELSRGRVDAAVATSALDFIRINQEQPDKYRLIVLGNDKATFEATGGKGIPYWGFGAWNEWLRQPANADLSRKLYAASIDLIGLLRSDTDRIAGEVAEVAKVDKQAFLAETRNYWTYHLGPASDYEKGIRLLGSDFLPAGKQIDAPLTESAYRTLISDFKP